jgi:hypothetical protein
LTLGNTDIDYIEKEVKSVTTKPVDFVAKYGPDSTKWPIGTHLKNAFDKLESGKTATPPPPPPPAPTGLLKLLTANTRADLGVRSHAFSDGFRIYREDLTVGSNFDDFANWCIGNKAKLYAIITNPSDFQNQAFVKSVAARYGPGGPLYCMDHMTCGNEPYINLMDGGPYALSLKNFYGWVKAANPQVKAGAAIGNIIKNGTQRDYVWVRDMVATVPNFQDYMDFWAYHPYCNTLHPADKPWGSDWYFLRFDDLRVNTPQLQTKPVILDEFGYAVNVNNICTNRTVTVQQQSQYLTEAWNLAKSMPYVAGLSFYHYHDWGMRDSDREHWFGCCEDASGLPRPFKAVVPTLS